MGDMFRTLCRGVAVVVDDQIGNETTVDTLISEIRAADIPVLEYTSLAKAQRELGAVLLSNFIILDWKMIMGGEDAQDGVILGEEATAASEADVIGFIRQLQDSCLAPIFIVSAVNIDEITEELEEQGIETGRSVFIESKGALGGGGIIDKIEEWIRQSPHVYLAKRWTKDWLAANNAVFWDLFKSAPDWPALFYKSFEADGDDPLLALRDMLSQLILSEIDLSAVDISMLDRPDAKVDNEALKNLYTRLLYASGSGIESSIRPGDVFKEGSSYFMNLTPECDTTEGPDSVAKMLLVKGDEVSLDRVHRIDSGMILPKKEREIVLLHLDGKEVVLFNLKKQYIKKCRDLRGKKVCRIMPPLINQIRQRHASFAGRFGVPEFPRQLRDALFSSAPAEQNAEPKS